MDIGSRALFAEPVEFARNMETMFEREIAGFDVELSAELLPELLSESEMDGAACVW